MKETMKRTLLVEYKRMLVYAALSVSRGYPGNSARIWTILISRRLLFQHLKTRTTVHQTTTLITLIWAVELRKCGLLCTASSRCNCGTCSVLWACVKWHDGLLDCHTRHELSRIELGWLRGASNPQYNWPLPSLSPSCPQVLLHSFIKNYH